MTDPLEDRLRDHFATRAGEVTADPDPGVFVERSAGRAQPRTVFLAGVAALVVALTGGGFVTGMSVAGSSPAPAPRGSGAAPAVAGGPTSSPGSAVVGSAADTSSAPPLTSLFVRTTGSGVTIRAYISPTTSIAGCGVEVPCPSVGVEPTPMPCPFGAMCAQPAVTPTVGTGGSTGTGVSTGTVPGNTGVSTGSGPMATQPAQVSGCQALTLELSDAQAVGSASLSIPTDSAQAPGSMGVVGSGSFGEAEGGPVSWVALQVGSGVSSAHLVSPTGAIVDVMSPASGVVVLATTGSTLATGTSAVGLDSTGAVVTTVPVDQATAMSGAPACTAPPPGPPVTTPSTMPGQPVTTTTPGATTSTGIPPMHTPPATTSRAVSGGSGVSSGSGVSGSAGTS